MARQKPSPHLIVECEGSARAVRGQCEGSAEGSAEGNESLYIKPSEGSEGSFPPPQEKKINLDLSEEKNKGKGAKEEIKTENETEEKHREGGESSKLPSLPSQAALHKEKLPSHLPSHCPRTEGKLPSQNEKMGENQKNPSQTSEGKIPDRVSFPSPIPTTIHITVTQRGQKFPSSRSCPASFT